MSAKRLAANSFRISGLSAMADNSSSERPDNALTTDTHDALVFMTIFFFPKWEFTLNQNGREDKLGYSQPSFEPVNRAKRKLGNIVKERSILSQNRPLSRQKPYKLLN